MPKPFDPSTLPEDVQRIAAAQVAAGRFASVEEVVRAGVEELEARDAECRAADDAAWERYQARQPADPRDMTADEALACIDSEDDARADALAAHLDALAADVRGGKFLNDTPAEMMARIDARLGVRTP